MQENIWPHIFTPDEAKAETSKDVAWSHPSEGITGDLDYSRFEDLIMLKMLIEIHPYGDETKKRTIGELFIANDMTGDITNGNYKAWLNKDPRGNCITPNVTLKNFDRNLGAHELVRQILNKLQANGSLESTRPDFHTTKLYDRKPNVKKRKKANKNNSVLSKRRTNSR